MDKSAFGGAAGWAGAGGASSCQTCRAPGTTNIFAVSWTGVKEPRDLRRYDRILICGLGSFPEKDPVGPVGLLPGCVQAADAARGATLFLI